MASYSSSYALCTLQRHISPRESFRIRAWSPVQNYVFPWITTARSLVTTHKVFQCSESDIGLSLMARPAHLTGSLVISLYRTIFVTPWKRFSRNDCLSVYSTGQNTSPTLRLTLWKNPTPVGGNFSDQSMMSVDVGAPPLSFFHQWGPTTDHLRNSFCICRMVTNEVAKVSASDDHSYPHIPEIGLLPSEILLRDDQYALGRLRGVSPLSGTHHEVLHMDPWCGEVSSHPNVISITVMCYLGVHFVDLTDD